jgi:hypothetical protein
MDDLREELEGYRQQLQCIVDAGFLSPCEAAEAADSIGCVVRLCRRGHISTDYAGQLIDQMGRRCADRFLTRHGVTTH